MRNLAVTALALSLPAFGAQEPVQKPAASQSAPEATSLFGKPLHAPVLDPTAVAEREARLAKARAAFDKNPKDADAILWLGRRFSYAGKYRASISAFTSGLQLYPDDVRLLRFRGHRYVNTRQFDLALADLEAAACKIEGKPDEVEPNETENDPKHPPSTLHYGVWYHLGLARLFSGNDEGARAAFASCLAAANDDEGRAGASHWLYTVLRRIGRPDDAKKVLEPIRADMKVIEGAAYHRMLLSAKGEIPVDDLLRDALAKEGSTDLPTIGYGVACRLRADGDVARANDLLKQVARHGLWPAFGTIGAEVDLRALGMEP
ncbi:MAG TPA: hypothetical protein VKE69_08510 [Planctomycetota bacterium]|nr:hypothetical protein [Planctomycetota bacterium]